MNRGHGRSELVGHLRAGQPVRGRWCGCGRLFVLHGYRRHSLFHRRCPERRRVRGSVRGRRAGRPAISAGDCERRHFRCVGQLRSSRSLVGADESYRANDTLEEGMAPVLELPSTFTPDRIAAVVVVLARALARQIANEIGGGGEPGGTT